MLRRFAPFVLVILLLAACVAQPATGPQTGGSTQAPPVENASTAPPVEQAPMEPPSPTEPLVELAPMEQASPTEPLVEEAPAATQQIDMEQAPVEQAILEPGAVEQAAAAADSAALQAPAIESSPPGGPVPQGTVVASSPQGVVPSGTVVASSPPRGAVPPGKPGPVVTSSPPRGATPPARPPAGVTSNNPLGGSSWQLVTFRASGAVLPGTSITLNFGYVDSLAGNAGCNSYSGNYAVNGAALQIRGISSTMMACGDAVDQQEQLYFALLQSTARFQRSPNQLILLDSAGRELLRYNRR